jgi:hypothetical protein
MPLDKMSEDEKTLDKMTRYEMSADKMPVRFFHSK